MQVRIPATCIGLHTKGYSGNPYLQFEQGDDGVEFIIFLEPDDVNPAKELVGEPVILTVEVR